MASFEKIAVWGTSAPLVGNTKAIFDTGTTMIVGDPDGIKRLYDPLQFFGARYAPEYGDGLFTSTCCRLDATQRLISPSQSLATSTHPSPFILGGRKS